MAAVKPITIDFETEPIMPRPHYPPKPVGFSIKRPSDRKSIYYAWGHPTGNNCAKEDAERVLQDAWHSGQPLLFQNGKFDVDVAETHMGCRSIDPMLIHDTLFLIYLDDPHAPTFSLKPSADRLLGMAPTEQQAVATWLVSHQDDLKRDGLLPSDEPKITMSNFGKWICLAPGDLVGKYADGDVMRTIKIFNKLHPSIKERGMEEAYDRERRLMPILLRNEREGMRVALPRMRKDAKLYTAALESVDAWLRKTLKTPELNIDSDEEMAAALDRAGMVSEWSLTATGKRSTSKKNLKLEHFKKPQVYHMLGYRSRLSTALGTFLLPMLAEAEETGGLVHANWNQVRQSKAKDNDVKGTRTGRLSVSRYMNMPKGFEDKGDGYQHPTALAGLIELPHMRGYILPDAPTHYWGRRDYNQQELRIVAHFEDGALLEAYQNNPELDTHTFVQETIAELLGRVVPRTPVKTLNFGYIYGQGVPSMAEKLNCEVQEIKLLRDAQLKALPGLKDLDKLLKARGKAGEPIHTWGGREYYCEEPKYSEKHKRHMTFEYKLLNYLIQGSAADCTKEALIRYDSVKKDGRFVVTVHDEIDISAPKGAFKEEMLRLRECMMSVEFDVPMLSDGEYGSSWGDLKDLKEPNPLKGGV